MCSHIEAGRGQSARTRLEGVLVLDPAHRSVALPHTPFVLCVCAAHHD